MARTFAAKAACTPEDGENSRSFLRNRGVSRGAAATKLAWPWARTAPRETPPVSQEPLNVLIGFLPPPHSDASSPRAIRSFREEVRRRRVPGRGEEVCIPGAASRRHCSPMDRRLRDRFLFGRRRGGSGTPRISKAFLRGSLPEPDNLAPSSSVRCKAVCTRGSREGFVASVATQATQLKSRMSSSSISIARL